jgi:hypothetical protein
MFNALQILNSRDLQIFLLLPTTQCHTVIEIVFRREIANFSREGGGGVDSGSLEFVVFVFMLTLCWDNFSFGSR